MVKPQTQRDFDRILLDTLNASPDAWNTEPGRHSAQFSQPRLVPRSTA
jgi:hypothetical protein